MDAPMDERTVGRLERELEEAITGVVARLGSAGCRCCHRSKPCT